MSHSNMLPELAELPANNPSCSHPQIGPGHASRLEGLPTGGGQAGGANTVGTGWQGTHCGAGWQGTHCGDRPAGHTLWGKAGRAHTVRTGWQGTHCGERLEGHTLWGQAGGAHTVGKGWRGNTPWEFTSTA